jgi:hypothetical protein
MRALEIKASRGGVAHWVAANDAALSAMSSDRLSGTVRLGVAFHLRDFLGRRVRDDVSDNIRERSSSMKNRKRESCTSGSVRDEGGNILIYSADWQRGGVAARGACAASGQGRCFVIMVRPPTTLEPP